MPLPVERSRPLGEGPEEVKVDRMDSSDRVGRRGRSLMGALTDGSSIASRTVESRLGLIPSG